MDPDILWCSCASQVHVDQELLIYEAFPHDSQLGQGNLKVRFKKVLPCGQLGGRECPALQCGSALLLRARRSLTM